MNQIAPKGEVPSQKPVEPVAVPDVAALAKASPAKEVGGPKGPEPTRYGDWESKGRCIDF